MPDEHDDALPRGALTPADLDILEGAGVFDVSRPGDHGRDAFDAAMIEDLDTFDASLIEKEGPDALTSDRALRLSQYRAAQEVERLAALQYAERDGDRVGYVLAAFRSQRGWSREQLADWLGVGVDDFGRLAGEMRPTAVTESGHYLHEPINALAEQFNAHAERLYEVFVQGDS